MTQYNSLNVKLSDSQLKSAIKNGNDVILRLSSNMVGNSDDEAKAHIRIINLRYLLEHGVMNLNYQMDHIQYQIFKVILRLFLKNMVKVLITHQ